MNTISNNDAKEHVSFRIEKNHLKQLNSEAKQNNTSLNTLVNQIIRQYLEWYSISSKIGVIPVYKRTLSMILEKLDMSDLTEIARTVVNKHFENAILMFKGEFTLRAGIETYESWIKVAGFPYKHEIDGYQHSFIIQHDVGNSFSIYQKEFLENLFHLFKMKPEINISDNHISFKFNLN
ncbi:MAG: hypothetical protein HY223_00485 [Thaumarchaeota archaeon]|nr:hypothetical protein [Nitrososphaerota archaeon]